MKALACLAALLLLAGSASAFCFSGDVLTWTCTGSSAVSYSQFISGFLQNSGGSASATSGPGAFPAVTAADFGFVIVSCPDPSGSISVTDQNRLISYRASGGGLLVITDSNGNPTEINDLMAALGSSMSVSGAVTGTPGLCTGAVAGSILNNVNVEFDQYRPVGGGTQLLQAPGQDVMMIDSSTFRVYLSGDVDIIKFSPCTSDHTNLGRAMACPDTPCVDADTPPALSGCRSDPFVVDADPGSCCFVDTFSVTASDPDPCGSISSFSQTAGMASGSCFGDGDTVEFEATDSAGQTTSCSWTYNVNDAESPVIACPADTTLLANSDCEAVFSFTVGSTDNCGSVEMQTGGISSPGPFPLGTTVQDFEATDAATNTDSCTFDVLVVDQTDPTASCPADITTNVDTGLCTAFVSYSSPVVGDNCGIASFSQVFGIASNNQFPVGTTTNSFEVTDTSGNDSGCSFDVTVVDNENPTISCPSSTTVGNTPGQCSASPAFSVTANDNCDGSISPSQSGGPSAPFPVGVSTLTFSASDNAGNSASCNVGITVNDVEDPTISCPGPQTVSTDPNVCTASFDITVTGDDNCPGEMVMQTGGPSLPATLILGDTSVEFTTMDLAGNSSPQCDIVVTVEDNQDPTVSCPPSIDVSNDSGLCSAVVSIVGVSGSDNCPGFGTGQVGGISSGSAFPVGVNTATFQATDSSGNTSPTCQVSVTVRDVEDPSITCPSDILGRPTDPGQCGAVINFSSPFTSDNCPGETIHQDLGPPSGSLYPVGDTLNLFSVFDVATNTASCNFIVEVVDNEPPTTVCPSDFTIDTDPGACTRFIPTFAVTATDNCGVDSLRVVSGFGNGATMPLGSTTSIWVARDVNGNDDPLGCPLTVTVVDNTDPTISCPTVVNADNDAGQCSAVVNFSVSATDNCPSVTTSVTSGQDTGSVFPVGTTTNTFVADDTHGGLDGCTFDVIVTDIEPPTLSCPVGPIFVDTDPDVCNAAVTYSVTDSDNCAGATQSQSSGLASGSQFPLGTTTNSFGVTDASGNSATPCSFDVIVSDSQDPTLTCPMGPINVSNDVGVCGAVVTYTVESMDNCPGVSHAQDAGLGSGVTFPVGATTESYTAMDASTNLVSCSFDVVVTDDEPPTLSCPSLAPISNAAGQCSAPVSYSVTPNDNCPGVTENLVSGLGNGASFPVGTTTETYTASDLAGNTVVSPCSFQVVVVDTENPTVSCPSNIAVNNDAGVCGAVQSFNVVSNDNCGVVSSSQTSGFSSGSTFPIGLTSNAFTFTDAAGNTNGCSFDLTVSDAEPPIAVCPSDIVQDTDVGQCSAIVSFVLGSNDNCPGSSVGLIAGLSSGATFPAGTTFNQAQATDANGNDSTPCSFTVTVTDAENPTVSCPADIDVNNDPGSCAATVSFTVSSSDNCPSEVVNQLQGLPSGSAFAAGSTVTQSFQAEDAGGNLSAPCSFNVRVRDTEAPTVTCPADIALNNDPGVCGAVVAYTVTTTDNCPAQSPVLLQGGSSGSAFSVGTTLVQYEARDSSGNASPPCDFDVVIADTENPTITCPANISLPPNTNDCRAVAVFSFVSSDNCGATVTSSHPSGSSFTGLTTVTGTATDAAGNFASCSFDISVVDTVNPTISCFSASASTAPGTCSATVFFAEPDSFDSCGVTLTRTGTAISGQAYSPGTYQSTFTATDPSGNFASCVTTVTVTDQEPPSVTGCPADISVVSSVATTVSWSEASLSATDNCGVSSQSQSHTPGSVFPRGVTTVTYSASDAAGNVGQCSFVVRVSAPGSISYSGCPSDITVSSSCSDSGTQVSWQEPVVSATALTYETSNFAPGSRFPDGITTISYVAVEDELYDTCIFLVTVEPCPAENGANRPPGAVGTIDLDGDGYFSDAPLLEWRDCCDSPEDACDDPFMVNPGAYEIPHNDQQDSCRGTSANQHDVDSHDSGCDRMFVGANSFSLVGASIPSEQTDIAVYALELCEFKEDDDDPSWGFDEQQTMIFSLANGTRNGYDIGILGPAVTQASVVSRYGGILPARGDFMVAISSGTARDETVGGHLSPSGATTGNTAVNLPATFLDGGVSAFIEDCATAPYAFALDSIRAHFRMHQPTNMNGFSFQALYLDNELEARQGSYPAQGTCSSDNQSWFLAIKTDSITGVSPSGGNFAGDNTGRSFNSFNANPDFWSQCNDYADITSGFCRDGATDLEQTGYTGASNWIPIGTSALPGESFDLEFITFDGGDGANDVTVLLDDFYPITEARTAGSSSWATHPWGYQFTADLQLVSFSPVGGSPILSHTASSVSFEFSLRNWGPEEANDVTISFTPPLGSRFTAAKDGATGQNLRCTQQTIAAPYADNGFVKCKWSSNEPLADQGVRSGTLAFALELDCDACPTHTRQMRFRVTATLSSIDRELGNNYLTSDISFV